MSMQPQTGFHLTEGNFLPTLSDFLPLICSSDCKHKIFVEFGFVRHISLGENNITTVGFTHRDIFIGILYLPSALAVLLFILYTPQEWFTK